VAHIEWVEGPMVCEAGHFDPPDDGVDGLAGETNLISFLSRNLLFPR
jgi:hypothetical protein